MINGIAEAWLEMATSEVGLYSNEIEGEPTHTVYLRHPDW